MIFRIWPLIQMSSLEQAFPSLVWLKEPTEAGKNLSLVYQALQRVL
ncbi:hypothetical protein SMQC19_09650 [Serratia marcescens]|nr:hypothetical protein SMQC19_09650 [Serratia marcescens]